MKSVFVIHLPKEDLYCTGAGWSLDIGQAKKLHVFTPEPGHVHVALPVDHGVLADFLEGCCRVRDVATSPRAATLEPRLPLAPARAADERMDGLSARLAGHLSIARSRRRRVARTEVSEAEDIPTMLRHLCDVAEQDGRDTVCLTVKRKRDPGDRRVRLLGTRGPLSTGPLHWHGGDRYVGFWPIAGVRRLLDQAEQER